jgi:hypothetical protein
VIARWIGRSLDAMLPPGLQVTYRHYSVNPEAGVGPQHKRAGGPAFYTRAFCRSCNSGWMGRLEETARPLLEPLIHGRAVVLEPSHQGHLAFWATKTVLAFQSIEEPSTHWASDEIYRDLYRSQGPLPYSQVWLGAHQHGHPAWQRSHSIELRERSADGAMPFGATLTVGHGVFHLVVLPGVQERLRLRPAFVDALREIWPGAGRSFMWPPPRPVVGDDLTGLARMIAAGSVLKPR